MMLIYEAKLLLDRKSENAYYCERKHADCYYLTY